MQDQELVRAARDRLLTDLDGCVTMLNTKTGQHRTFRVKTQPAKANFAPGKRILELLTGPDNTHNYQSIGFVFGGKIVLWRSKRTSCFRKLADMLERPSHYEPQGITYQYEARCRRCHRLLTHPESLKLGLGPDCAKAA